MTGFCIRTLKCYAILPNLKIQSLSLTPLESPRTSWSVVCSLSLNDSRLFSWCSSLLLDRRCPSSQSKPRGWSLHEKKHCNITGIATTHRPFHHSVHTRMQLLLKPRQSAQSRLVFGASSRVFAASFRSYVSKQTLASGLAPLWAEKGFSHSYRKKNT